MKQYRIKKFIKADRSTLDHEAVYRPQRKILFWWLGYRESRGYVEFRTVVDAIEWIIIENGGGYFEMI